MTPHWNFHNFLLGTKQTNFGIFTKCKAFATKTTTTTMPRFMQQKQCKESSSSSNNNNNNNNNAKIPATKTKQRLLLLLQQQQCQDCCNKNNAKTPPPPPPITTTMPRLLQKQQDRPTSTQKRNCRKLPKRFQVPAITSNRGYCRRLGQLYQTCASMKHIPEIMQSLLLYATKTFSATACLFSLGNASRVARYCSLKHGVRN